VVTIVVSMFTRRKPEEELVGLVRGLTPEVSTEGIPLHRRPEAYAIISLLILILLNIYYW
jgi:SSS family solute:Na+ symporter